MRNDLLVDLLADGSDLCHEAAVAIAYLKQERDGARAIVEREGNRNDELNRLRDKLVLECDRAETAAQNAADLRQALEDQKVLALRYQDRIADMERDFDTAVKTMKNADDARMMAQEDAAEWRRMAQDYYCAARSEPDYPVEGALDAIFAVRRQQCKTS